MSLHPHKGAAFLALVPKWSHRAALLDACGLFVNFLQLLFLQGKAVVTMLTTSWPRERVQHSKLSWMAVSCLVCNSWHLPFTGKVSVPLSSQWKFLGAKGFPFQLFQSHSAAGCFLMFRRYIHTNRSLKKIYPIWLLAPLIIFPLLTKKLWIGSSAKFYMYLLIAYFSFW